MRTDEPMPRNMPSVWSPHEFAVVMTEVLTRPDPPSSRSFADMIAKRRSAVGDPIKLSSVAELLWYAVGWKGYAPSGRGRVADCLLDESLIWWTSVDQRHLHGRRLFGAEII